MASVLRVCHSADYINFQPPRFTQAQWTGEVGKMQHSFGAPLTDGEVKLIGAYLAVAYGSANISDASIVALSSPAKPAPTAASIGDGVTGTGVGTVATIDVNAVMAANACMGCHTIDKKLVGPSFQDVAAKYRGDANALGKVADSIRQGGVGKWGNVAMPPAASLSAADAKALAVFVLQR